MGRGVREWASIDNSKRPDFHPESLIISTRAGRNLADPLTYRHPYDSMRRYAQLLALRHDSSRTRHAYYRASRFFGFCHPSARNTRERIAFHCGSPLFPPATDPSPPATPLCPCCRQPMRRALTLLPLYCLRPACFPSALVAKATADKPP